MAEDTDFPYTPADFPDPHDAEVDVSLIDANLRLSPRQRLEKHEQNLETIRILRRASIRYYGRDLRIPETPD